MESLQESVKMAKDYDESMEKVRLVLESVPDDDLPATGEAGYCVVCHGCGDPECCGHDERCDDPAEIREVIALRAVGPRPPRPEPPLVKVVYCPRVEEK